MKINKQEFLARSDFFLKKIKRGAIFIYPTDTIYGIGCDATNPRAIKKIRKIKSRDNKPFSIIIPDKSWISENCEVRKRDQEYIDKFPGTYTLIFKLKSPKNTINNLDTIGVRIPDNWFAEFLSQNNILFVTTSVNISGEEHITSLNKVPPEIAEQVDYIIDDGDLENSPSQVINLSEKEVKIIR